MSNMMSMSVMTFWVKKSLFGQTAQLFMSVNADHSYIRSLVKLDTRLQTSFFMTECRKQLKWPQNRRLVEVMSNIRLMLVMMFRVKKWLFAQTAQLFMPFNADHCYIRCLPKLDIRVETSILVTESENRPKWPQNRRLVEVMSNMMSMSVMTFWVKKSLLQQTAPLFMPFDAGHYCVRRLSKVDIRV